MVNTKMWHHPKYYAALRAERKKLLAKAQAQAQAGAQAQASGKPEPSSGSQATSKSPAGPSSKQES